MHKLMTIAILVLGLVAGLAGQSRAFEHKGGRFLKSYELLFSAEQNARLEALTAQSEPELRTLREKVHAEMKVLRNMTRDETKNDAALKAQVQKIADAGYALVVKEASYIRAVRKIATKEQLAKIDAQRDKREKKRAEMREAHKAAKTVKEAPAAKPEKAATPAS